MKRVEEWWIRYHFADAETRRMMALRRKLSRGRVGDGR